MTDRKTNCPVCGSLCIEHTPEHDGATGYYAPIKQVSGVSPEAQELGSAHNSPERKPTPGPALADELTEKEIRKLLEKAWDGVEKNKNTKYPTVSGIQLFPSEWIKLCNMALKYLEGRK